MKSYDAIILGSGQGGNALAGYLSKKGEKVLLIEKDRLGGTCVNTGCTPSKTFHEAIRKIYHGRNSAYAGFRIREADFDFKALVDYATSLAESSRQSMVKSFAKLDNLTVARGHGRFLSNHSLRVTHEDGSSSDFSASRIYICTGSRPRLPKIAGLEEISYYTNLNIWNLRQQPRELIILGGGYIGLEFAQNFARLGSQVRVISHSPQIISHEDDDIIAAVQEKLEAEGVQFHLNARPSKLKQEADRIELSLEGETALTGDCLVVAAGRKPNTDQIGLENTDLEVDKDGAIAVDDYLYSGVEGIYALGEVAGSAQFTHISYDDFRIIRNRLENKDWRNTQNRIIPYTLFTDPQLAAFGYNEKRAKKEGIPYKLYEMPMSRFSRASERNEVSGKAKVLCDPESGQILGATIFGFEGGELMSLLQVAARGNLSASDLRNFTFAHPLMAEGLNNLFA